MTQAPNRERIEPNGRGWMGAVVAAVAAGPLVMMPMMALFAFASPGPWRWADLGIALVLLFASLLVGIFPGLFLCLFGSIFMTRLQERLPIARAWPAWMLVGLLIPIPLLLTAANVETGVGGYLMFAPSCGACALICWYCQRKTSPTA